MNNLNSVLIEGNVTETAVLSGPEGRAPFCAFVIRSNRCMVNNTTGKPELHVSHFAIQTWGEQAKNASIHGKKNVYVRIVGALRKDECGETPRHFIEAEHCEFRPNYTGEAVNLNSILLEGELLEDPALTSAAGESPACAITMVSRRINRFSGTREELERMEITAIAINGIHGKIVERIMEHGRKDRGVRAVGRILQSDPSLNEKGGAIQLYVEQIEFRPEFARKSPPKKQILTGQLDFGLDEERRPA